MAVEMKRLGKEARSYLLRHLFSDFTAI